MKRQVRVLAWAQRDLARLEYFLRSKSLSAANRAAESISEAVQTLEQFAERHPVLDEDGTRELIVRFGRDGYVIQYRIAAEIVLVGRIFHGRELR